MKYDAITPNSYQPDKVPKEKWIYYSAKDKTWKLDATFNVYSSRD